MAIVLAVAGVAAFWREIAIRLANSPGPNPSAHAAAAWVLAGDANQVRLRMAVIAGATLLGSGLPIAIIAWLKGR